MEDLFNYHWIEKLKWRPHTIILMLLTESGHYKNYKNVSSNPSKNFKDKNFKRSKERTPSAFLLR